jgi:beta-glucanase (GH16 family)
MLGNTFDNRNWPQCGEIDIMESIGKEPSLNHGSLHGPGYSGSKPKTAIYTLPEGRKFADAFHTFSIDWTSTSVTFYVDETAYNTVHDTDIPPGSQWVFNQPFFLLLNVAVGGNFAGPVDETTVFPQEMLVDYVRVYKRL